MLRGIVQNSSLSLLSNIFESIIIHMEIYIFKTDSKFYLFLWSLPMN